MNTKKYKDHEWIRGLKENDPEIVNTLWEMVFRVSYAVAHKYEVYDEDVVRDAAFQAFKRIRTRGVTLYDYRSSFTTYCWAIVGREVLRELKKRNKRIAMEQIMDEASEERIGSEQDGFNELELDQEKNQILTGELPDCLEKLSTRERQVFELRYVQEKDPERTAEELGIKRNYVNVILCRARQNLKRCLEDALG